MAFDDSITLKTLILDATREYQNEKINVSGIRVIKLGYRPAGVEIWISTDNTGDNLYKLENKGDGWVNIPEPLYNCYITTSGTHTDKITLYYSGELSDNFAVGNAVTERIGEVESVDTINNIKNVESVELIKSFDDDAKFDLYDSLNNTFNLVPYIDSDDNERIFISPIVGMGKHNVKIMNGSGSNDVASFATFIKLVDIKNLDIQENEFYKISIIGHLDITSGNNETLNAVEWNVFAKQSLHLNLYNISKKPSGVTFTDISKEQPNFPNLWSISGGDMNNKNNHFSLYGLRSSEGQSWDVAGSTGSFWLNYNPSNVEINMSHIIEGSHILKYTDLILLHTGLIWIYKNASQTYPIGLHFSLIITISKAMSNKNIIESYKLNQILQENLFFNNMKLQKADFEKDLAALKKQLDTQNKNLATKNKEKTSITNSLNSAEAHLKTINPKRKHNQYWINKKWVDNPEWHRQNAVVSDWKAKLTAKNKEISTINTNIKNLQAKIKEKEAEINKNESDSKK